MSPSDDADRLARSLQRMEASLQRVGPQPSSVQPAPPAALPSKSKGPAIGLLSASMAMLTLSFVIGQPKLLIASFALLVLGGIALFASLGRKALDWQPSMQVDPTRAHIGMGADVAGDATIEPGASIEMGADVGAGTIVRRGAVVAMGASVGKHVVLEAGARVEMGASVHDGAVVGAQAIVGTGATVEANAKVPAGTRMFPGSTFRRSNAAPAAPAQPADPRHARIDLVCDRLDAELKATPENLRQFLGEPGQTITSLRGTCHDLLRRESVLRLEASPEAFARLEHEKASLTAKAQASTDAAVRRSLEGAVAAIDDQLRQRGALKATADRLDAESTRLVLTLEGMSAQIIRLTTASAGVLNPADTPALAGSMKQLHDEIDAVAEALESLSAPAAETSYPPIAPVSAPEERSAAAQDPVRVR